jgi:hypothetical protein
MKFKLLHFTSFIFVCAVFLGAAGQALACLCPVQGSLEKDSVRNAKADSVAVFTGEVISIGSIQIGETEPSRTLPDGTIEVPLPQYKRVTTFKITAVWKGDVGSEIRLLESGTGCDFPFEVGKLYLVYAYGKALTTNSCSRTALIDAKNTRKEIKILNKLRE